jgi:hypothetical protein
MQPIFYGVVVVGAVVPRQILRRKPVAHNEETQSTSKLTSKQSSTVSEGRPKGVGRR